MLGWPLDGRAECEVGGAAVQARHGAHQRRNQPSRALSAWTSASMCPPGVNSRPDLVGASVARWARWPQRAVRNVVRSMARVVTQHHTPGPYPLHILQAEQGSRGVSLASGAVGIEARSRTIGLGNRRVRGPLGCLVLVLVMPQMLRRAACLVPANAGHCRPRPLHRQDQ